MRYFTWKLKFVSNSLSMIVSRYTSLLLTCPRRLTTWSVCQFSFPVLILYWKTFKFGLGHFLRKIKEILAKIWLFLAIGAVNKDIKSKRKFCRQSWSKNDFLIFYQIFLSLQVKQSMIISNAQNICELPHELPNDLRLRRLGN